MPLKQNEGESERMPRGMTKSVRGAGRINRGNTRECANATKNGQRDINTAKGPTHNTYIRLSFANENEPNKGRDYILGEFLSIFPIILIFQRHDANESDKGESNID